MVSTYPSEKVRRTLYLIQFWLKNKLWICRNPEMSAQSNLDYPDLDYSDFSLVAILSWISISYDQDP